MWHSCVQLHILVKQKLYNPNGLHNISLKDDALDTTDGENFKSGQL